MADLDAVTHKALGSNYILIYIPEEISVIPAGEEWEVTITTRGSTIGNEGLTASSPTSKQWIVISNVRNPHFTDPPAGCTLYQGDDPNNDGQITIDGADGDCFSEAAWIEVEIPPCPFYTSSANNVVR